MSSDSRETDDFAIDLEQEAPVISPLLFGHNLEHSRRCIWQGLSAQLLRNRKFYFEAGGGGVAHDWYRIGPDACICRLLPKASPYTSHHPDVRASLASTYDLSTQVQKVQSFWDGVLCGIGQDGIHLVGGVEYEARFALHSSRPIEVKIRLCDRNRQCDYFIATPAVVPGDWQEFKFTFNMPMTDSDARLEITFAHPGTLFIGVTALTRADTFHGMRRDVIDLLKEISVPLLRWPGGNFAGDYHWKDGLLPADRRGGLKAFTEFTNCYTHNYDDHEIGTDEYVALCRELGAEPSITINMSTEGPKEAAQWVEYCNGSADTEWGRVRADRGHAQPYNVKYWSLGNEMGYGHMKGPNAVKDYLDIAAECAAAMKKVAPGLVFIASGTWDKEWIKQVPPEAYEMFDHVAYHRYIIPPVNDLEGEAGRRELARAASMPDEDLKKVTEVRQDLDAHVPKHRSIGIAYDEWNMAFVWINLTIVVDGVYAAGFLNMLSREAHKLGISMGAYFEPVNEGAIVVDPVSSRLTPIGQVFALFKDLHGGRLLKVEPAAAGSDLDVTACRAADGRRILAMIVNRNHEQPRELVLRLAGGKPKLAAATCLIPDGSTEPTSEFVKEVKNVVVRDGVVSLTIPRFSVVRVEIEK